MSLELKSFSKATEFRDRVLPFLRRNEAQNCLGLGIIDTLINRPEIYPRAHLWALTGDGQVMGAAWMTPPHPIGLTEMPPQAMDLLISEVAQLPQRPQAVTGPKPQSDRFRDHWTALHGLRVKSTMEQRIYQLAAISMPFSVPGEMRIVNQGDQALLEAWNLGFIGDCGLNDSLESAKDYAARAIKTGSRYLWVAHGAPVSMAGASGSTPSGVRISWVYTPKELRGRGYASALVAALSQRMLSEGRKFCFLYTDLANPTSNSIYQKIGYRPVCDAAHHTFTDV